MSIAIVGQGFVGGTLTTVLSERGEKIYVYDKDGKIALGGVGKLDDQWSSEFSESGNFRPANLKHFVECCEKNRDFSGVFFVCVPTPMNQDGSANLDIVFSVLNDIALAPKNWESKPRIAVIKSTVPPGSVEHWNEYFSSLEAEDFNSLHVIFNPEFLTEANALDDMRNQDRIILGGPRPYINTVKQIYQRRFPKIPIIKTSSTTAEMVKYLTNCFLAVKVSFANEIAQICESLDHRGLNIDYDKVIEYAKLDKRIGDSHWSVPGPVSIENDLFVRGFGGHCFPKDLNALIFLAKESGVNPTVMEAAWEKNLEVRLSKHRDWEKQIGRAVTMARNENNE